MGAAFAAALKRGGEHQRGNRDTQRIDAGLGWGREFANDADSGAKMRLIHLAILIAVTVAYALILTATLPKHITEEEL